MPLTIISGGQSGVDRAALDAALALGILYAGFCPRGGWAEDFPDPPGLLARYPLLRETPSRDPAQRTEWNVRDSDAVLILTDHRGLAVSQGTAQAHAMAQGNKPVMLLGLDEADALTSAVGWLETVLTRQPPERVLKLGVGGPRECEAPGIYARAFVFLQDVLRTSCRGAMR